MLAMRVCQYLLIGGDDRTIQKPGGRHNDLIGRVPVERAGKHCAFHDNSRRQLQQWVSNTITAMPPNHLQQLDRRDVRNEQAYHVKGRYFHQG